MDDDPRDYRKRLTDAIFNTKYEISELEKKIEANGGRCGKNHALMERHDCWLAYAHGLVDALKMFDDYQDQLRKALDEAAGRAETPATE